MSAWPDPGRRGSLRASVRPSLRVRAPARALRLALRPALVAALRPVLLPVLAVCIAASARADETDPPPVPGSVDLPQPKPADRPGDAELQACLRTIAWQHVPVYPVAAARAMQTGNVVARATFRSAGSAPDVQIVYDAGSQVLADAVRGVMGDYRMRCFPEGHAPVVASQVFKFTLGARPVVLKSPMPLDELVALDADLEHEHVRFEFDRMGCPFELSFVPLRPYADNTVRQVEAPDARRGAFIAWLRKFRLRLPDESWRSVVGEPIRVRVPCTVLDLT